MKPVLQAILLADHIYEDRVSGKKVVAGIFGKFFFKRRTPRVVLLAPSGTETQHGAGEVRRLKVQAVGAAAGAPFAYLSLTAIQDKVDLELRYMDLEDYSILLKTDIEIRAASPLETVEAVVPLPPLPIPHAGSYLLEALVGEESLGSFRVLAIELAEGASE